MYLEVQKFEGIIHSYIAYELASSFIKLTTNLHLQKPKLVLFIGFHQVLHMQAIHEAFHSKL